MLVGCVIQLAMIECVAFERNYVYVDRSSLAAWSKRAVCLIVWNFVLLLIIHKSNLHFSAITAKMEFQLPGMGPPPGPPGPPTSMAGGLTQEQEQSFLGALTSPEPHTGLGPPGFPPPGAFHPGFPHGPPGPHMGWVYFLFVFFCRGWVEEGMRFCLMF